jgi:hypothetical protein
VRESDLPTRREKHTFFRDVAFRRQNDDVNLRQRIKRRLIAPFYDVVVGLEDIATGMYREARCGRHRQLLFDADPTEIDSHRWSRVLTASEAWWRTLHSTGVRC